MGTYACVCVRSSVSFSISIYIRSHACMCCARVCVCLCFTYWNNNEDHDKGEKCVWNGKMWITATLNDIDRYCVLCTHIPASRQTHVESKARTVHSSQLLAFVRFQYARMCTYALYFWCRASLALLHFIPLPPALAFPLSFSVWFVQSFHRLFVHLSIVFVRGFSVIYYTCFSTKLILFIHSAHTQYFSISLCFALHSFFPSSPHRSHTRPPHPFRLHKYSAVLAHHPIRQIYPMNMYALVVLPFMLAHQLAHLARFVHIILEWEISVYWQNY